MKQILRYKYHLFFLCNNFLPITFQAPCFMAKDPAFLFYPSDYVTGTMHLDFECKGAYIDLLMLQFQKGHMTLHMIRQVLGHRFDIIWPQIQDKFKKDKDLYYNERLRIEKERRASYCQSRRDNKNVGKKH